MAKNSMGVRQLRAECTELAQDVLKRSCATEAEIADWRPGGIRNPDLTVRGWFKYFRRLANFEEREYIRRGMSPKPGDSTSTLSDEEEQQLIDAVGNAPLPVELNTPNDDGSPRIVSVRSLSYLALIHLTVRDRILRRLAEAVETAATSNDAAAVTTMNRALEELVYQQMVCVWIATSEAAPRLPFDPVTNPRPTPPGELALIDPIDVLRIMQSSAVVNRLRLAALQPYLSGAAKDADAAGWSTFFSALERESNGTVSADRFIADRALVGLLATKTLAAAAERKAMERAKKDAEGGRTS